MSEVRLFALRGSLSMVEFSYLLKLARASCHSSHVVASHHYAEQLYSEICRCVYESQEATWQQRSALLATATYAFVSIPL